MVHNIRVVIVAPQDLVRCGLLALLTRPSTPVTVVCSYRDWKDAEPELGAQDATMLLLDEALPNGVSLLDTLYRLHRTYPTLTIILLGTRLNARHVRAVFRAGVSGYLHHDDPLETILITAILTMAQGLPYTSPSIYGLLMDDMFLDKHSPLSDLDREVLRLIGTGKSVQEIALTLERTSRTIYRIRSKLRHRLGARTNEHIVVAAIAKGLMALDGRLIP